MVTVWTLESRYDIDKELAQVYSDELSQTGYVGSAMASTKLDDEDYGSTPFNFRNVCQLWKVIRKKKFAILPGESKSVRHSIKRLLHITDRIGNLDCIKGTQAIHWNAVGPPVNDVTTKSSVASAQGSMDVLQRLSYNYMMKPVQNRYIDFHDVQPSSFAVNASSIQLRGPNATTTTINA